MIALPWITFAEADSEQEYLVLLSFLPLKSYLRIPTILSKTFTVQRQLSTTPGVIGYSLLTQPLALRFFTLSVWTREEALSTFVRTEPHKRVMRDILPLLHQDKSKFLRWNVKGKNLPVSWKDALKRFQQT